MPKQSIYRKMTHCSTCPFLDNGKKMLLHEDRLKDIKEQLLNTDTSFNCHKTVYSLDEELNPTKKQDLKMCYGAYVFLKNIGKQNQVMQVAERLLGSD